MSGSSVINKLVRPVTKCSSGGEGNHAEQELNGLEESEDAITDDGREGLDEEGEAGTERKHEATHMPFRDWCTH